MTPSEEVILATVDANGRIAVSGLLPRSGLDLRVLLSSIEREIILQALGLSGWNQVRAARLLRMTFRQLRYRVARHGIVSMTRTTRMQNAAKVRERLRVNMEQEGIAFRDPTVRKIGRPE
jgi:hypothetical protein